ncbi:Uncharacterized protein C1450.15 [Camellia lanceoleosa]|uniref:Uncharacterized protein C1450.15 n=1 Tax=Camellia lanceoleosa TaxID=1840588 RepID=A0ACC0F8A4_9ERIC|nr:Uncharacterized protein C1450.15 [Camellia lanceoleosa]
MEEKKKQQPIKGNDTVASASAWKAFLVHLICGLGLASALQVAQKIYSVDLNSDPSHTLRLIWVIEAPIVILIYSLFRKNPKKIPYWKAVGRGILGLPAGAVVNALGAIALGAPVGIKYFTRTLHWSLLMSLFTVVPAVSVFGLSWTDWQQIFAHTKPSGSIDYMVCLPAYGAVIGAWFGAWPMPLDWERPWQEWPICVSYGVIAGYLVAMVASFSFILLRGERQHVKGE